MFKLKLAACSGGDSCTGGDDIRTPQKSHYQLDLSYLVEQLSRKPEYRDWTPKRFSDAVDGYRAFLAQCKETPGANVPTSDVDAIWHQHILNTQRYMEECIAYFGYYLHHKPAEPKTCSDDYITPKVQTCSDDYRSQTCSDDYIHPRETTISVESCHP